MFSVQESVYLRAAQGSGVRFQGSEKQGLRDVKAGTKGLGLGVSVSVSVSVRCAWVGRGL